MSNMDEMNVPFHQEAAPSIDDSGDDEDDLTNPNSPCSNGQRKASKCGSRSPLNSAYSPRHSTTKSYHFPTTMLTENIPKSLDEADDNNIIDFLKKDLNLDRLDKIHSWLWIAGRPQAARPLHRQLMMQREIMITEQFDLHLVWRGSHLFLKPLPAYLLDHSFWKKYILCQENDDEKQKEAKILCGCACGLLLSYVWLIQFKSDMKIALEKSLIPKMHWKNWRSFTKSFLSNIDPATLEGVDRRFHHGELRASRLNWIYRAHPRVFSLTNIIRGYFYGYNRYGVFFWENFAWVITVFAYLSVLLSAMQLGWHLDQLQYDIRFKRASYGFALFSIFLPIISVGVALVLFVVLFSFNWMATEGAQKKAQIIRHGTRTITKESWWKGYIRKISRRIRQNQHDVTTSHGQP
jgi:uncharacterized membrane protein